MASQALFPAKPMGVHRGLDVRLLVNTRSRSRPKQTVTNGPPEQEPRSELKVLVRALRGPSLHGRGRRLKSSSAHRQIPGSAHLPSCRSTGQCSVGLALVNTPAATERRRLRVALVSCRGAMTFLPAADRYDSMQYPPTGRSGLHLPAISLGLWQNFGGDRPFEEQRPIIHRAFDLGVTHFDLANNYGRSVCRGELRPRPCRRPASLSR